MREAHVNDLIYSPDNLPWGGFHLVDDVIVMCHLALLAGAPSVFTSGENAANYIGFIMIAGGKVL